MHPFLLLGCECQLGFNMDQLLHRLGFQIYQCFADFNWSFVDLQSVIVIVVFVLFLWMALPSLVISLLQSSLKASTVFQNSSLIRWNFLLDVDSPSILYLEWILSKLLQIFTKSILSDTRIYWMLWILGKKSF
jgi:flagellar biosynthesis protein FliQ